MSIHFPMGSHSSFYESFFERAVLSTCCTQAAAGEQEQEAHGLFRCSCVVSTDRKCGCQPHRTFQHARRPSPDAATQDEGLTVQVRGDSGAETGVLQDQSDARLRGFPTTAPVAGACTGGRRSRC